jgi:hypothetical protein
MQLLKYSTVVLSHDIVLKINPLLSTQLFQQMLCEQHSTSEQCCACPRIWSLLSHSLI